MKKTFIVEPVLFCYMVCNFLIKTAQQQLVYRKVCLQLWNSSYCDFLDSTKNSSFSKDQDQVQSETARWLMYVNIAVCLPSLLPAVLFGSWSDVLGRIPVMRLPFLGDIIGCIGHLICSYYINSPVSLLLPIMAVGASFGGFATVLATTNAYVSDVTTKESRTRRITVLEAMIYSGNCLGELVGGLILQYFGFIATFGFIASVLTTGFVYIFFLNESYQQSEKVPVKRLLSLKYFKESAMVYLRKRPDRCRSTLAILLAVFSCIVFLFVGLISLIVLYAKHPPRNFSPADIGYITAELNILKTAGALVFIWLLTHRYKWTDYSVSILGCLAYTGFGLSVAFGHTRTEFWLATSWAIGFGLGMPPTRAAMSKMVSPEEKGKMFSFAAAIEVLLAMLSGITFSKVYQVTVSISDSFCFYMMAGITIVPLLLNGYLKLNGQQTPYTTLVSINSEDTVSADSGLPSDGDASRPQEENLPSIT